MALIGDNEKAITLSALVIVPPFLRFGDVSLAYSSYRTDSLPIAEKCDSFRGYLPSIKASLYDSNVTQFCCAINQEDPNEFRDYLTLLDNIREIVSSFCDSSRGYSFLLNPSLTTDSSAFGTVIASILEMPAISRCSYVYISLYDGGPNSTETKLPIETISNWLNRERHEMGQKQRERNLVLGYCCFQDAQTHEMCDFLKQVSFIFSNIYPQILFL